MTEHSAPSTYILRQLNDVEVALEVSGWPQTIGWKIVACLLLVMVIYFVVKAAKTRWKNRYRGEAINALFNMHLMTDDAGYRVFSILKQVLFYLDSNYAPLNGTAFLQQLDRMWPHAQIKPSVCVRSNVDMSEKMFSSELGERWMLSLVNPDNKLSHADLEQIIVQSIEWVKEHQSERA